MGDQKKSLELFRALGDVEALEYAERHFNTIRRFGRFPARNAILGRTSTQEEQAFLNDHPLGF